MPINRRQSALLRWYRKHHRDFPWRQTKEPYRLWVSEVMLQQTQCATVLPYYNAFVERFPDVATLAEADLSQVLKQWEGLGYYSRARHLHKSARIIRDQYAGELPQDSQSLKSLPGIGDYTAAAIASIAFGEAVPVLDSNVRRVLARWIVLKEITDSPEGLKKLREAVDEFLHRKNPGDWNQAVMELGALVCTPRNPRCAECPVTADCQAFQQDATHEIPMRRQRKPIPHYQVTAGLIQLRGKLLITKRREEGMLGGLWEFPGGKQEPGETLPECLQRELKEELDIETEIGEEFCSVDHAYTHFKITLHVFRCRIVKGKPRAVECDEVRWIRPEELGDFAFPRADRKVIEKIINDKL